MLVRPRQFWNYIMLEREDYARERNPHRHGGLDVPLAIINDRFAVEAATASAASVVQDP